MLKPNHDFCPTLNKIFQFFLCLFLVFYLISILLLSTGQSYLRSKDAESNFMPPE